MVLQLGRLAETDAIFTFFVSSSLLIWHAGYAANPAARWRRTWPWLAGYLFAALGALDQGPQAPVYFVGAVGLYLAWRRDWRQLASWPHLAGLALFVGMIAAWQIPFFLATDWASVRQIWMSDVGLRFEDAGWIQTALHFCSIRWVCWFACSLGRRCCRRTGSDAFASGSPRRGRWWCFLDSPCLWPFQPAGSCRERRNAISCHCFLAWRRWSDW